MRTIRYAVLAVASLCAGGCATAISGSAENVSRLEQQHATDPQSEALQRSLGIAYFKANRLTDARTALEKAASMDKNDGVAALYLGMTAEAQNDLPAAATAYRTYLDVGKTRRVKNQIRDRLDALKLKAIQAEARAALAKESQFSAGPANTVAVMPFQFTGADTSLKPIERGFAELVTTDLSRVAALTVLERERLQGLLDEIALQQNGVAANTGVRAGKMLQVGRMVGGAIQQNGFQLRTDAVVTDVSTSGVGPTAEDQRSVDDIFTMEKNIVLSLLQNMGITPTTAERNAIEQRQTRSLAAFLAFSRGLELDDQGRYPEASREFDRAVQLDPNFGAAAQKGQEARSAVAGQAVNVASVESALRGTTEGSAVFGNSTEMFAANGPGGATAIADGLNPSMPGAASYGGGTTSTAPLLDPSAGTGKDNPAGQTARVTITIKQP